MDLAVVFECLVEHLPLGALVRVLEALCDRSEVSSEMRAVLVGRIAYKRPVRAAGTFAHVTSTIMHRTRSRCRECGVLCTRKCAVCWRCSRDPHSYVALVSRAELVYLHQQQTEGWTMRRSALLRRLAPVRVVTCTPTGAFLYWRKEALQSLCELP